MAKIKYFLIKTKIPGIEINLQKRKATNSCKTDVWGFTK